MSIKVVNMQATNENLYARWCAKHAFIKNISMFNVINSLIATKRVFACTPVTGAFRIKLGYGKALINVQARF